MDKPPHIFDRSLFDSLPGLEKSHSYENIISILSFLEYWPSCTSTGIESAPDSLNKLPAIVRLSYVFPPTFTTTVAFAKLR